MNLSSYNGHSSSISSSVQSEDETNDPLMRDCYQLQQKLLETEKSLNNLQLATSYVSPVNSRVSLKEATSPQSEKAATLTLADLTPDASQNDYEGSSLNLFTSENHIHLNSSFPKLGNLEKKKSCSSASLNHMCSTDISTLRQKLSQLREENSTLFLQNNRLMSQLENTSFELQQSKEQLKELNSYIHEVKGSDNYKDIVESLQVQLDHKNFALRELEELVLQLRHHIYEQENQSKQVSNSTNEKLCQNEETNRLLEEKCKVLQKSYDNLTNREQELEKVKKNHESKISWMQKENSELREKSDKHKETNLLLQENLASLKLELVKAQETSTQCHGLQVENNSLKELVEDQHKRLVQYEDEVHKTKEHMVRLEAIIQRIQEDRLANSMSRADSGIGFYSSSERKIKHEDGTTPRSLIADLKLKLAMKESEILRLQALITSNTKNQQKLKSDFNHEGSSIQGLRSELSTVVEHYRNSDQKQIELEQKITRLEEEILNKTNEILELNERLSDKTGLLAAMENRLNQRNSKFMQLQQDFENINEKNKDAYNEANEVRKLLEKEKKEKNSLQKTRDKDMRELKSINNVYADKIIQLENVILAHDEETTATDNLVSKLTTLHSEHCQELQQHIEKLQSQLEEKAVRLVNLESQLETKMKDMLHKDCTIKDLKEYLSKMEDLLSEKKKLIEKYEEKLANVQEKLITESKTVSQLKTSVDEYQNELKDVICQLEETRMEQRNISSSKSSAVHALETNVKRLQQEITIKEKLNSDVEKRYNQSLDMLAQSQKRISELEDMQAECEDQIAVLKHSSAVDKNVVGEELCSVKRDLSEANQQITLYQKQVDELNDTLEEAKQKFIDIAATLQEKDVRIHEQIICMKEKSNMIETMDNLSVSLKKQLEEKDEMIQELQNTINKNEEAFKSSSINAETMQNKVSSLHEEVLSKDEKLQALHDHVQQLTKDCTSKHHSMTKMNRMLSIGQDELNIKGDQLRNAQSRLEQLQSVVEEQRWQLKQKAAEFTQLEMNFKNNRSEFEKKVSLLEENLESLKYDAEQKSLQLDDLRKEYSLLRKAYDERKLQCEEYQRRFKIQEEAAVQTTAQVQLLKKELDHFQTKLRNQIQLEEEVNGLRSQLQNNIGDYQSVESQLMISQQSVVELTRELDDIHSLLSLKEKDCARLARELGASQVREAQEKSRLNQEFRKSTQENEFKFTKKSEELDKLRQKHEKELMIKQQEIMKMQIALQRSQDETRLCKNDLDRYKLRVQELDDDVQEITVKLQLQEEKCKEVDEAMVLKEAEIARFSAKLSSYERSALTNRTKSSTDTVFYSDHSSFKFKENLNSKKEGKNIEKNSDTKTRKRAESIDDLLRIAEEELNQLKGDHPTIDSTLSKSFNTTYSNDHASSSDEIPWLC